MKKEKKPDEPFHILLVEDSLTQAFHMRHLLEEEGFMVTHSQSAEHALTCLEKDQPDLMIVDYHLPGMNGGQLAHQIKMRAALWSSIPILIQTEDSQSDLERKGLESGADDYISKSADVNLLILKIKALLRQQSEGSVTHAALGLKRSGILVVSDNEKSINNLLDLLRLDGNEVHIENNTDLFKTDALSARHLCKWADCIIVNISDEPCDGIAICQIINKHRRQILRVEGKSQRLVAIGSNPTFGAHLTQQLYEAGVDDLISYDMDLSLQILRIRILLRRKLHQDESRRLMQETHERQLAMEAAKAEAREHAAKASFAEALKAANAALADKNQQLRTTQSQLVQTAKMASLGELVAGIAHEINNPLAFILAHKETISSTLTKMDEVISQDTTAFYYEQFKTYLDKCQHRMQTIELGLSRIQNLVLKLRNFSRLDEAAHQKIDVAESIETILALLAPKIGNTIKVVLDLRAEPVLLCQPALLNQGVMNILSNAADAINEALAHGTKTTGHIAIETSMDTRNEKKWYVFRILDNGPGLAPDSKERVFEPFYTTKKVGVGTGLGLSIAYNVVQAHQGEISVEEGCALGGACFVIAIPLMPEVGDQIPEIEGV